MKKLLLSLVAVMLIVPMAWCAQGFSRHPNVVNTTLTTAGTEYSVDIPQGTGAIAIQSRTAADFRLSDQSNQSMTTFYTVKSGTVYTVGSLGVQSTVATQNTKIYFSSATAGQIVETLYWN